MTCLKLAIITFPLISCQLFAPKVSIIKQKDISSYLKQGSHANDCLSMPSKPCRLFKLINQYRVSKNTPPLIALENCVKAARAHSENMYKHESLKHDLKNSQWSDRIKIHGAIGKLMAENIAVATTATDTFKQWLSSKYHRKNIENPNFTHTGVGQKGRYWTQCLLKKITP